MRLAFCLFKYFPYGGLQRDFMAIAQLCQQRGHHIDVYTCGWQGERPEQMNIHIMECAARVNHRKYQRYADAVQLHLNKSPVDRVIGFNKMPGLDVYFASDPCYMAKPRHFIERWLPRYQHFKAFEAAVFSLQQHAKILVLSEAQQQEYQAYWQTPQERFIMMPPGISREACAGPEAQSQRQQIREELGVREGQHLLLMIGSGFRTKGLDRTLRAVQSLPEALRQETRLVVIGQDKANHFERQIRAMGLADQVRILPGRDDIPAVMQAGDLLLHPALREVAGKVILESVVAGLPALVTDICGYAPHVAKANAGIVLKSPFDQESMNRKLADILTGDQLPGWRKNGIAYGQTEDLYSMDYAAVDAIEAIS